MKTYAEMSKEELLKEKESLEQQFKEVESKGLNLNMARGKPSEAQLNLSLINIGRCRRSDACRTTRVAYR